ncbi:hypothetical protein BJ878DRAFT_18065 [Calycina marina]|uniref:Uncharacterized protein n=1 Tax=Calycina marina TaxID=1763456 RepID=A0A9P7Z565_9HELO|nr:hypothetical protein BJ878DRAFT_18065 [Calycina marina]
MSYGITTSFKFRTTTATEENVFFYYPYVWTRGQTTPEWNACQQYCAGQRFPAETNARVLVTKYLEDVSVFLFEGAYHGSKADFELSIQPFLDSLALVRGLGTE